MTPTSRSLDPAAGTHRRFVIIHGGWQTAAAWAPVADALRRAGHECVVPELPAGPDTTIEQRADAVTELLYGMPPTAEGNKDLVLVAHSLGGPVAQLVAPAAADRIATVVSVGAWLLADGLDEPERVIDLWPAGMGALHRQVEHAARCGAPVAMAPGTWTEWFAQDVPFEADLDNAGTPACPVGLVAGSADWQDWWDIVQPEHRPWRLAFLAFRDDQVMPPMSFIANAQRTGGGDHIMTLPGSHQGFQRRPVQVAHTLMSLAA
jgi:pimeloyl-ACP methyl ester carboxylesterase